MSHPPTRASEHDSVADGVDGRTDVKMPRGEIALLVSIVIFAVATFMPVTHDKDIAGIPVMAWLLWFLMTAAPAAGLVLALRSGKD